VPIIPNNFRTAMFFNETFPKFSISWQSNRDNEIQQWIFPKTQNSSKWLQITCRIIQTPSLGWTDICIATHISCLASFFYRYWSLLPTLEGVGNNMNLFLTLLFLYCIFYLIFSLRTEFEIKSTKKILILWICRRPTFVYNLTLVEHSHKANQLLK
jgi:hypothetical protein